jgi:signal transduction histidine kinase
LVKAVRAYVDQQNLDGLRISVEDAGNLSSLPAAVEVAAYRIALEGFTNITRHAQASSADIRIYPETNSLIVEVIDDGIGLPDPIPVGVGVASMRERAEELGGRLELSSQRTGTQVRACLPITRE